MNYWHPLAWEPLILYILVAWGRFIPHHLLLSLPQLYPLWSAAPCPACSVRHDHATAFMKLEPHSFPWWDLLWFQWWACVAQIKATSDIAMKCVAKGDPFLLKIRECLKFIWILCCTSLSLCSLLLQHIILLHSLVSWIFVFWHVFPLNLLTVVLCNRYAINTQSYTSQSYLCGTISSPKKSQSSGKM